MDYDVKEEVSQELFATVQNKLHFAIHGHTAAELMVERIDTASENMGLTTWKGEAVRKSDIIVPNNYLTENELKSLNRIVTMYLDYAECQAKRNQVMYMKDWEDKLNVFLQFNDQDILQNAGKISREVSDKLAEVQYEKYNQNRLDKSAESDFDKFIKNNRLN